MNKKLFTIEDCIKDSHYKEDYEGKIIVMRPEALKDHYRDERFQLWLGGSGFGCDPSLRGRAVFATCLYDNEHAEWRRENFLGTIKPEALPDWARLKLSQMKLHASANEHEQIPKYRGYSFLENGRYNAGVSLYNEKEVLEYIELQKPYQHRIMICDPDDSCLFEMVRGKIIHPTPEVIEAFCKEQQAQSGMNMNL